MRNDQEPDYEWLERYAVEYVPGEARDLYASETEVPNAASVTGWRDRESRFVLVGPGYGFDPTDYAGERDGGIVKRDLFAPVAHPFTARSHAEKVGRSRKGKPQRKVIRQGSAYVVGALDADVAGRPLLAQTGDHELDASGAAARVLLARAGRGEIRRMRIGMSVIDITKATDAGFGDLIPRLLSTEGRQHSHVSYETATPAQVAAIAARHVCGLSAGASSTLDRFVAPAGVHGPITLNAPTLKRRPVRGESTDYRLPIGTRKGDPRGTRQLITHAQGTPTLYGRWSWVSTHVAGSDFPETLYVGHTLTTRPPAVTPHTTKRAERTAATTVPTVATDGIYPTDGDAWQELLDALTPGGRLAYPALSVTRGDDGRYSAVDHRPGREHRWQTRSAAGMALRLS